MLTSMLGRSGIYCSRHVAWALSFVALALSSGGVAHAADEGSGMRTGYFLGQEVEYETIAGLAVIEGDIVLGPAPPRGAKLAVFRAPDSFLWPDGVIAFEVDNDVPERRRIDDTIRHWEENTVLRFIPRTIEDNWIRFVRDDGLGACFSSVGMVGGMQTVRVDDGCDSGTLIHEIGHVAGLWHEQSRPDRDNFVVVNDQAIEPRFLAQFAKLSLNTRDFGGYDYASIMHYASTAFSLTGSPTITTFPLGIPIGQRVGLSALDIDGVQRAYGSRPTRFSITTNPAGLQVLVDGQVVETPQTFDWDLGSNHRLGAPREQARENSKVVFGRWSDDGPREHLVQASSRTTVFTASYAEHFQLDTSAIPENGGVVSVILEDPIAAGFYPEGTALIVNAVPSQGFFFGNWTLLPGGRGQGLATNPAVIRTQRTALTAIAEFWTSAPFTVNTAPVGLAVEVDDADIVVAPHSFRWPTGSGHPVAVEELIDDPLRTGVRHRFREWSDAGDARHIVTITVEAEQITAMFDPEFLIQPRAGPPTGGEVILTPIKSGYSDDGYYRDGELVSAEAVPEVGHSFSGWSGLLQGLENPTTFEVSEAGFVFAGFQRQRQISPGGVVNGASFGAGPISPGEIINIFGSGIGPNELTTLRLDEQGRVSTELADTKVRIAGVEAALIFVSSTQIGAVVPYEVEGGFAAGVEVEFEGSPTESVIVPVGGESPALFTVAASGSGPVAALNQDGGVNTPDFPAPRGSIVTLFGTGEGQTEPPGVNGQLAGPTLAKPVADVKVLIGGEDVEILYAGAAPGLVAGVIQVNARVPQSAVPMSKVAVRLQVGQSISTAETTIFVD